MAALGRVETHADRWSQWPAQTGHSKDSGKGRQCGGQQSEEGLAGQTLKPLTRAVSLTPSFGAATLPE